MKNTLEINEELKKKQELEKLNLLDLTSAYLKQEISLDDYLELEKAWYIRHDRPRKRIFFGKSS